MTVAEALPHLAEMRKVHARLKALQDVGSGTHSPRGDPGALRR